MLKSNKKNGECEEDLLYISPLWGVLLVVGLALCFGKGAELIPLLTSLPLWFKP